ncbi:MAG: solute:sodium symporter family transporter [Kiritimatiellales bacterium]|nr:solute:sodium symporter family transporter [Kiritimatiellales bacterium]
MDYITIATFLLFTLMVAVVSYFRTRNQDLSHSTGYFLAGRSLSWYVIAGSLFLTNISAEQMTGLNGNAFASGACVMAWETIAAAAMVAMALFFLPRYLKSGITTIPQFLELRYGRTMRTIASFIFLYALIVAFLPFVLYAGAITLGQLFNVSGMLGVSEQMALWIMVIALGVVGGCYAVFGGLKAVAVSDTINGIGLMLGGFMIPLLALYKLGGSSVAAGWRILLDNAPERLQAAGLGPGAEVPWHTLFTGMLVIQVFYWCTNQAIVQRTFAAKDLAEGQKGVLFAALLKMLGVAMLVLPGIIAWHMHQRGLINVPLKELGSTGEMVLAKDLAYPLLVRHVLPPWLTGFFGAVMFGAVLSSFNSGLNSMSTLFSLDIYKQMIRKNAPDSEVVVAGKIFGTVLIVVCILIAPAIGQADGLFTLMRKAIAVISIPIFAVILMGVMSRRAPALGGYIALPAGMLFFCYFNFIRDNDFFFFKLHWLHMAGLNLLLMMGIMAVVRWLRPLKEPYVQVASGLVDIADWKYARHASWGILLLLLIIYTVFSRIGVIETGDALVRNVLLILAATTGLYVCGHLLLNRMARRNGTAKKQGKRY